MQSISTKTANTERPSILNEWKNALLLVILYMVQGVPLGLCLGSMPFLMQATMSYTEIGIFSLAGYPYSFKLLWSPIVDTIYSGRIGRRKTWIIPLQTFAGIIMIFKGDWLELSLKNGNAVAVTTVFFFLVLIAATQDIAVDGWALTLLSKENVGYAATCQTIGMNIGYFSSFTIFLALNDPSFCSHYLGTSPGTALVSLSGYLRFWGYLYLIITMAVALFKNEGKKAVIISKKNTNFDNIRTAEETISSADPMSMRRRLSRKSTVEDLKIIKDGPDSVEAPSEVIEQSLKVAYLKLWKVVKLPSVQSLGAMLVFCRLGVLAAESAAALKLLEKGVSKEALGGLVLVEFPIEIFSAVIAGRWAASTHPLQPWLVGYQLRLVVAAGTVFAVWVYPFNAPMPLDAPGSFSLIALFGLLTSFSSTLMFTAIGDFYNRISDPVMGGAYLTLLNTIANIGVIVPKIGIFAAIDFFSVHSCILKPNGENHNATRDLNINDLATISCKSRSTGEVLDDACAAAGGECVLIRDGFYIVASLTILFGMILSLWLKRTVSRLESLPTSAWRAPIV